MTRPRNVVPGRYYLITRRCTQGQFLLRPSDAINETFEYCLGEAANRFGIVVLTTCVMSNHHHTVIYDRRGNFPEFLEHLHKMVARSVNALLGRSENLWSSHQASVVHLVNASDVIEKVVYALTNPVKDQLVELVHQWPGVNSYANLVSGKPKRVKRPKHFFRDDGKMPAEIEIHYAFPDELGDRKQLLHVLKERVAAVEARAREKRREDGTRVMGRSAVKAQSWTHVPPSKDILGALSPRIAAKDAEARTRALRDYRMFLADYRNARADWLADLDAPFPAGTYWLRRFARIRLAA